MNWRYRLFLLILVSLASIVLSCSKEKSPEKEARGIEISTQQAAEAIKEYGKRPIDKAKKTQSLGENRTRGIDEAVENMDKH